MPKTLNPICGHQRDYACISCGRCDGCCECMNPVPELAHVDSKEIATRWRILRIMAMDHDARKRQSNVVQRND